MLVSLHARWLSAIMNRGAQGKVKIAYDLWLCSSRMGRPKLFKRGNDDRMIALWFYRLSSAQHRLIAMYCSRNRECLTSVGFFLSLHRSRSNAFLERISKFAKFGARNQCSANEFDDVKLHLTIKEIDNGYLHLTISRLREEIFILNKKQ